MQLDGKIAAVTGAGTGIGRAIALALAAEGANVAVTDLNEDWARRVAAEVESDGGRAMPLRLDVTDVASIEAALQAVLARWERIDVWCNNAGVSTMNRFVDLTEKDWDFNMNVNAKGVFLCSQVVARQMMVQGPDPRSGLRGKIINTASMAGKRGAAPFLAHYVASKFAVVGLTQATALELAPYGITVNAVCPGYVRTSMQKRELKWEAELRGTTVEEVKRLYIADTPLGRIETPEDVAGVVVFLATPAADFITGEAINVNGGAWMD
ncbi:MAG TPA: 3-oxoacyl-ACP reductase FabG [Anaerolineae bacterium]|nr:3-oxoacyl-ACP reductase FabG [Anaerolineae bacterium]HIQ06749.1 3-oxoacyl-ACP reductase FabG [Anaerolineae bacterium]